MTSSAALPQWNALDQRHESNSQAGRPRKVLQKRHGENVPPSHPSAQKDTQRVSLEPRASLMNRRRMTSRDQKIPLGPRPPQFSPSKRITSDFPASHPNVSSSYLPNPISEPFLGLSARRVPSHGDVKKAASHSSRPDPYDLTINPSPEYEAAPGPRLDFPIPTSHLDPAASDQTFRLPASQSENSNTKPTFGTNYNKQSSSSPTRHQDRPVRTAPTVSHHASGAASTNPFRERLRRQSQLPPSVSTGDVSRAPRKSVGPGYSLSREELASFGHESRYPSNSNKTPDAPPMLRKISNATAKRRSNAASNSNAWTGRDESTASRSGPKTQSFHQASRQPQPRLPLPNQPSGESSRQTIGLNGNAAGKGTHIANLTRSPSTKRQSTAVGGLGARTVSPTDARRSRRMSVSSRPPPMPDKDKPPTPELPIDQKQPPTPPPARQTSMTPTSTRATPERTQRHSLGRSLSSRSSYSSLRPMSSSMQLPSGTVSSNTRPMQQKSQDTPNIANTQNGGNKEALVPPVPAIPRAYESPRETQDRPFFPDVGAPPPSYSASIAERQVDQKEVGNGAVNDFSFNFWEPNSHRKLAFGSSSGSGASRTNATQPSSRGHQGVERLPPLNLLPLSTPTAAKIASFAHNNDEAESGNITPPTYRQANKTPSTPMTASKATFSNMDTHRPFDINSFSRIRSSTSYGNQRSTNSTTAESCNQSPTLASESPATPATPFFVPSPTQGAGSGKTRSETNHAPSRGRMESIRDTPQSDSRRSKSLSRRPSTASRSTKDSNKAQNHSNESQDAYSGGSSLRRKLSLSWRRSSSKASLGSQHTDDEKSHVAHITDMPPPKIPASATAKHATRKSPKLSSVPWSKASESLENLSTGAASGSAKSTGRNANGANGIHSSTSKHSSSFFSPVQKMLGSRHSQSASKNRQAEPPVDMDDLAAEEEMKKLGSKQKEFEYAARELDEMKSKAKPKERVSPGEAARLAQLNIFERGEIIDHEDVYFCGAKNAKKFAGDLGLESSNFGFDDERGDYNVVIGDHLAYRYEVVDILGKGSFGQVVRCIDHKTGALVAIKIIRNKKRFHQQALVEVNILQKLREWDSKNVHSMVNFTQSFYFRGHLCIATELLGINLYEFIKAHNFAGFSLKLIRRFAKQMLSSLCLLQNHNVIHCDLKPENILLAHPLHSNIKTIDFGSSCFENEKVYTYIQSRFYRSPEVILGMSYGMPIDMWSLGCILAELLTGYPIFPGENEQEQLACIMEVFGPPEKHLIERSTRRKLFFDSLGKPRITVSSKGKRRRPSSKTLSQAIKCDDEAFVDFLAKCLRWDPGRRMKPNEAMQHEFITGVKKPQRPRSNFAPPSSTLSPGKRSNTVQTPLTTKARALPETPATSFKNGVVNGNRNVPSNSSSPVKGVANARRKSNVYEQAANTSNHKRMSSGTGMTSALPRVTSNQRSTSGKPDLASAAAIASLNGKNR